MEKRRQALQEAERREQERRAQKQREEQERREKEARDAEERRRKEEEKRLERLRELERQREEERQREIERKEVNVPSKHLTDCGVEVQRCDSHVLFRLHSGSSSGRGKRSGRGGVEESSRSRGSRSRMTSSS